MKKTYFLALALVLWVSCSPRGEGQGELPAKISKLPVGIEVKHSAKRVYAVPNKDLKRGGKFKWKYQTSVKALNEDLKIIEFGGFILEGNQWVEKNLGQRPFNNNEFQEWYKCPDGLLKKDVYFTDANNWGTSNELTGSRTSNLWYYIGANAEGQKFVGYGEIVTIGRLKE
ncbi:MAG: hypothetical protein AAFX87_30205 [Bacteroidota bacterium]